MLETWFWWQNQCFVAWGIIWEASGRPDGQELGGWAVGGQGGLQGGLQGVKSLQNNKVSETGLK